MPSCSHKRERSIFNIDKDRQVGFLQFSQDPNLGQLSHTSGTQTGQESSILNGLNVSLINIHSFEKLTQRTDFC